MIAVGAAVVDITPPAGQPMAGFAARTDPALDAHDPLTARALVVDDTALVTVDVIGIDAEMSHRVRNRCALPAGAVTVVATHTHGGPISMPRRLAVDVDQAYMERLENGIVLAIDTAAAARRPARMFGANGADPGYAKNRRGTGGSVDHGVPAIRFDDASGNPIAILVSYACHPVVLGPDNRRWTGDYPYYLRESLETDLPGAIALFATGCAGDVNTGHSAASSLSNAAKPERSFDTARTIGRGLARAVTSAGFSEIAGGAAASETEGSIAFELRETELPEALADQWLAQAKIAPDGGNIHRIWARWARTIMGRDLAPQSLRCTALCWGDARIVALPGEIFAQTALEIRESVQSNGPILILAYADDNPGYIPPRCEYDHGGYEVDEAHRFYGLGATMAPGSAERLASAGCDAVRIAVDKAFGRHATKENATKGSKS